MIRRAATQPDGSPAWVLISQIEHARLASDLAEHWGGGAFPALAQREEVLEAIYHHDDGWAEWEQAPGVDPVSGRPLAFTEMPLTESLAIWRRSIDRCAGLGPLAGWMVAGHFMALLRSSTVANAPLACDWLREFDHRRSAWLAEWLSRDSSRSPPDAGAALGLLQLFDMLSLWFCCAERSEPAKFSTAGGPELEIMPQSSSQRRLRPWPLCIAELEVAVAGERIAALPYRDAAELAAASREPVTLRWQLRPTN